MSRSEQAHRTSSDAAEETVPGAAPILCFAAALARGQQEAACFVQRLSPREKSALLEEAQQSGFESLTEAVLGLSSPSSLTRQRIERFRFASHRRMTGELTETLEKKGIPVIIL